MDQEQDQNQDQDQNYREVQPQEFSSNIAMDVVLTLITCGIYNLFWQYRQMKCLNTFLAREEFNFWMWFFLSLITCGIWHIFMQYQMGRAIVTIQEKLGKTVNTSLPGLSVILTVLALSVVTDAIHQNEINDFFE